ncbi:head GIN domain-containing protein [Tsuneonella sp. SYSU-LHT278]|uniref:head GIN domain-containing protein n=1 Tax=Tsuneonella sediminis TaxID=3416089 RepID=UPI003F792449
MLHRLLRGIAPVVALAAAFGASGCDGTISINGDKGVPLGELDTSGKAPTALVLAGPDTVLVKEGAALEIDVAGDPEAVSALRFTLDDEALGILRKKDTADIDARATVTVTMPRLEKLTLAGSGTVDATSLAGKSEVTIAGSGTARTRSVSSSQLDVTIAGSGSYSAAGRVEKLDLTVAGSGNADMADLEVQTADITIAGSGKSSFASNGQVKATVMGSGDVTVTGSATCTIKSMGSGTLRCNPGSSQAASSDAPPPAPPSPETPTPPRVPDAP